MRYELVVTYVNEIFDDYPGMKLTLRQIFYRLVADHGYPNTKSKYTQLSTQLVKARQRGDIDESRIEDRSRQFLGEDYGWESLDDFIDPDIEEAWIVEAEKRWQEIEQGKVECMPVEEVMSRVRSSLRKTA